MEVIKSYSPGEIIFRQGESCHTMLLIKEGSVEVFRQTEHDEVLLTVQNAGEIIGLLSFFNNGKRLASARARSHVEGQLIERKAGEDHLLKLPKWVQLVIKEFALRLSQIDDQYSQVLHEKNELMTRVVDPLMISTQLADCFASLGSFKAKKSADGKEILFLDEMLNLVETCLGYERGLLNRVIAVFKTAGLIKIEIEQDKGKEVMSLTGAMMLKWYSEFVRTIKTGKNRRLVESVIAFKHRKVLFALRDYVTKSGGDANITFQSDLSDLVSKFEAVTKIAMDQAAITAAVKLELIEIKSNGEKKSISFHPANLARTLIAVNVIRRLRSEPGEEVEEEGGS